MNNAPNNNCIRAKNNGRIEKGTNISNQIKLLNILKMAANGQIPSKSYSIVLS